MRAPTERTLGLGAMLGLLAVAALCPRTSHPSWVREPSVTEALSVGHRTSAATMTWLQAVQDFDTATQHPTPDAQATLIGRLHTLVSLDPSFSHGHIAGALMLKVAAPESLPGFVAAGRARRHDLPWTLLEAP